MRRATGLDHLTMLDIAPPEFVGLAAGAGFSAVSLRIAPVTAGEEAWPMLPGSPMLAETVRRLAGTGVRVLCAESIAVSAGRDIAAAEPVIAAAAALGAQYVNVTCDHPDTARFAAQFAALADLARPYGVRPVIEFMAYRPVRSLAAAVSIARGSDGGAVLLDTLHIHRCGATASELAGLDPALLSYLQVCDAPRRPYAGAGDAMLEARTQRLLPGEGELPLADMLGALPADLPVSVEAPCQTARAWLTPAQYAAQAHKALRAMLG
jgi:sugar phosphate isomerase/epimerase